MRKDVVPFAAGQSSSAHPTPSVNHYTQGLLQIHVGSFCRLSMDQHLDIVVACSPGPQDTGQRTFWVRVASRHIQAMTRTETPPASPARRVMPAAGGSRDPLVAGLPPAFSRAGGKMVKRAHHFEGVSQLLEKLHIMPSHRGLFMFPGCLPTTE